MVLLPLWWGLHWHPGRCYIDPEPKTNPIQPVLANKLLNPEAGLGETDLDSLNTVPRAPILSGSIVVIWVQDAILEALGWTRDIAWELGFQLGIWIFGLRSHQKRHDWMSHRSVPGSPRGVKIWQTQQPPAWRFQICSVRKARINHPYFDGLYMFILHVYTTRLW